MLNCRPKASADERLPQVLYTVVVWCGIVENISLDQHKHNTKQSHSHQHKNQALISLSLSHTLSVYHFQVELPDLVTARSPAVQ